MNDQLPEGWNLKKISEIGKVIGGGTPSTKVDMYYGGDIPWLTPKDLSNYNYVFIDKGERNITKLGLKNSSAKLMPKGTVLFSSRAPIGYVAIAKNDISTNQGFKSIICNKSVVDNEFIYYTLKYYKEAIENIAAGSTFKEVSGKVLKEFKIPLPPLSEQKEISKILFSIDKNIELNHQMNQTLEEIGQAIFRQWFVHFEFPDENGQPYKSSGGEMVDSELGAIPKNWSIKSLGDICDVKGGKRLPKGHRLVKNKTNHPYIRVTDLNNQGLILDNIEYLEDDTFKKIKRYIITEEDIYISIVGTIGLVGLVPNVLDRANLTENCAKLTNIRIKKELLTVFLKSYNGQEQIKALTVGSTQGKLALYRIKEIKIALPNDEVLLEKIQLVLSSIWKIQNHNLIHNQNLTQIRDSLLPKLMSGKIRVLEATVK